MDKPPLDCIAFILHGKTVSGKNQMRTTFVNGKKRLFPNSNFVEWRNVMSRQIWQQRIGMNVLFSEPVSLTVHYFPGDRMRRDATGMLDALFHLLEKTNVLKDDSLVKQLTWVERALDSARPRVHLYIQTLA